MGWEVKEEDEKKQPEFSLFHSNILYAFSFLGQLHQVYCSTVKHNELKFLASKLCKYSQSLVGAHPLQHQIFIDQEQQNFCLGEC